MRGVFITGTGTGVGKTVVTAAVLRRLRNAGFNAVPFKPVQTGGVKEGSALRAPDLDFSLKAAGLKADSREYNLMCPYIYTDACSPHLAGRIAGQSVQLETVLQAARSLSESCDFLLAEGAGGIMVPLNERETMLDLMVKLSFPVVVVSRGTLGTINHTLLSLDILKRRGLTVIGVVVNDAEHCSWDFIRKDNPFAIERMGGSPILGDVPFIRGIEQAGAPENAWSRLEEELYGFPRILSVLER